MQGKVVTLLKDEAGAKAIVLELLLEYLYKGVFESYPAIILKNPVTTSHKILSPVRGSVTNNNGFWIELLNLLTPYTINQLLLTSNTALSLIYTIYSSPFHTH
jgi:hypothetical protein